MVDGSWFEIEREIDEWLRVRGECTAAELGKHLGMSEAAAVSLICLLATEGKLRVCGVAAAAARREAR